MLTFESIDAAVGNLLEGAVQLHHRRRLARQGWRRAIDPPGNGAGWATTWPPPRDGVELAVHVDGDATFARMVEVIEAARSHVHVASWWLTPKMRMPVERGDAPTLRELLARRAADGIEVRVLQWAGFPLPGTPVSRGVVRGFLHELADGTEIRWRVDPHERPLHCHHEKLVLVDDEVAFIGGIDLTTSHGDRRDSTLHADRGEMGWHDVACELRGPVVADVARHFAMRWNEADAGEGDPESTARELPQRPAGSMDLAPPAGMHRVVAQVARTVPERIYDSLPRGAFGIAESYVRALRRARSIVYLENQFLWSPEIVSELQRLVCDPPTPSFRLVLVLPAHPATGGDDTRGQLGVLLDADAGRGIVAPCCPYARPVAGRGCANDAMPSPVYVHAKVGIVDDEWMSIGSANLNEHSLFNDSEVNVVTQDHALARDTRLRLWSEHLGVPIGELESRRTVDIIDDLFVERARAQRDLFERGVPPEHHLLALPGVSRRSKRVLGPLQSMLVDG